MLHTYVHLKETPTASWDVAHVYEHLFIRSFYSYAEKQGISAGVIGFTLAATFENAIFIDAGFYNKYAADLYTSFIATGSLDMGLLDDAIAECQAEERSLFTVTDQAALQQQLTELAAIPWQASTDIQSKKYDPTDKKVPNVITQRKSANSFRTIKVGVYLENPTLEEALLWLRLSVIVSDTVLCAMREKYNSYFLESHPTADRQQYVVSTTEHRIRKGTPTRDITTYVQSVIAEFDVDANMPYITDHFNELPRQPLWKSLSIDYYRSAGYIANLDTISSLATAENIKSLLGRLRVKVRAEH